MTRYRRRGGNSEKIIGLVLGAVLASGLGGKAVAAAAHGGHHSAAPSGGTLGCSQLEALWKSAGGSPSAALTAAEIATAESSGRQYATLADGNGTVDRGYWQINSSHGSLSTYDAHGNARAAVLISRGGTDWTPWTTYRTGAYTGKC